MGVITMTMQAIVLSVQCDFLMVLDQRTNRTVRVLFPGSCRFRAGQRICIRYNGVMTASIPPQISASSITALPWFGPFSNVCR